MSGEVTTLISDAVADPPRIPKETNLNEQIEKQKCEKTPPNPEIGNASSDRDDRCANHENASVTDDRDNNHARKPKRNSRNNGIQGRFIISNNVRNSSFVNIWNQNGTPTNHKQRGNNTQANRVSKEMPDHIQNLIECQATIKTLDKLIVKQNISKNWKKVANNLPNLQEIDVQQCLEEHSRENFREKMFQVLTVWNYRCGSQATIDTLIKVLWDAEEYSCAEALAVMHKSE